MLFFLLCVAFLCFAGPKSYAQQAEHRDGYTVTLVDQNGHNAYLLIPDQTAPALSAEQDAETSSQRLPAVLVLHDHGAHFTIGKEKMVRPIMRTDYDSLMNARVQADAEAWVEKCYSCMFVADSLAKAGYVVLVTDALYWGERGADGNADAAWAADNKALKAAQPDFYRRHLDETGEAWFHTILREDRQAVSYLCSLPMVDTTRIYSFGFSMGAYRSWQLAAADPRIAACAAANWMTTVAVSGGFVTGVSSWAMYQPEEVDYPLIAAKISPRPFLLLYGTKDHVLPEAGTRKAIRIIRRHYNGRQFRAVPIPADHVFTPEHWQTLRAWLKNLEP